MSGGKKAQRTKGNAKPSSSSRAAEFLHQEGQTGFIGFSNLSGNNFGYVPQPKSDESELDADLRLLLRKMTKKDTITRLKAVQEFTSLCKEKDQSVIQMVLTFWPRIYNKLAHDFDHRVRESAQQAHHQMVTKAGRNLALHLKQIITNWLMSFFDTYHPAASVAKTSFSEVFQEKKQKEVLIHCKKEIFEALQNQILNETADTLSDPKVTPFEEREAKYARYISSSLLVLNFYMASVGKEMMDEAFINKIKVFLSDKKFWKLSKYSSVLIRNAYYDLACGLCMHVPDVLNEYQKHFCSSVLLNIDEQDPLVVKTLWNAILLCVTKIKTCWEHVSYRKAVLPKLWKVLRSFCNGNASVIYPNLLPFLSELPKEVLGDGIWFYEEFFNSIMRGIQSKLENITVTETNLSTTSYVECLQYLLMQDKQSEAVIEYLINEQLNGTLHDIFYADGNRHMWFGVFFKKFSQMLYQIRGPSNEEEKIKATTQQIWNVINNTIFENENNEDSIQFKNSEKNFFLSLVDFIFSLHQNENLYMDILHENFITKSFIAYLKEIFERKNFSIVTDFFNILKLILNPNVIKFLLKKTKSIKSTEKNIDVPTEEMSDEVSLLEELLTVLVEPLLIDSSVSNESKTTIVQFIVQTHTLIRNGKKKQYLKILLNKNSFNEVIELQIITELLKYSTDDEIFSFMKNSFIQDKIISLCSKTSIGKEGKMEAIKWNILRGHTEILKDDLINQPTYHAKLLPLMKERLNDGIAIDYILECFLALTKSSNDYTADYFETFLKIMTVYITNDSDSLYNVIGECAGIVVNQSIDSCEQLCNMIGNWLETVLVTTESTKSWPIMENIIEKCVPVQAKVSLLNQILEYKKACANWKKNVTYNEITFFIDYLLYLVKSGTSFMEGVDKEMVYSRLLDVLECSLEVENLKEKVSEFFSVSKSNEDFLVTLMKEAIERSHYLNNTALLSSLFKYLNEISSCSEELLELLMEHAYTEEYQHENKINALCVVISEQNNISNIRALVEKYTDEFENNDEVKTSTAISGFIKVLSRTLFRWYQLLQKEERENMDEFDEYDEKITIVFNILLNWKESNADSFLFSIDLNEVTVDIVELNINLMLVMENVFLSSVNGLVSNHWDFILCALVSWLETCKESLNGELMHQRFYEKTFRLFYLIAVMFHRRPTEGILHDTVPPPHIKPLENDALTPDNISDELQTEWMEFFLPAATKCLISVYTNVIDLGILQQTNYLFATSLSRCLALINTAQIEEFIQDGVQTEEQKNNRMGKYCEKLCKVLNEEEKWCYKVSSYHLMHRLGEYMQISHCISVKDDNEEEEHRNFPPYLIDTMERSRDCIIEHLTEECVSIDSPLEDITDQDVKSSLLTYLLSWLLILKIFKTASPDNRAKFANVFYKKNYVNELVTCLFCLVPGNWNLKDGKYQFTTLTQGELQNTACLVIATVLECIPALVRTWFNNNINRKDANKVDKFVSATIAPLLLKNEFKKLDHSAKEFNNMTIKTRPRAREIIAVYTVDEISMELTLKLANGYPLTPVSVECGKRIGVSTELWRQWMLQLTKFLSFQNGSILEGLELWKRNVDKRFEGVEECMVCFSVIHPSNYSLPTIACKTCKKKFHSVCLYKWFNTSGKSTCPLCRNIF